MPRVLARKFGIKRKIDNYERVLLNKRRKIISEKNCDKKKKYKRLWFVNLTGNLFI